MESEYKRAGLAEFLEYIRSAYEVSYNRYDVIVAPCHNYAREIPLMEIEVAWEDFVVK